MIPLGLRMEAEGLVGRTLIGRFRIDKILGRGGMATVYAAFDQQRASPVALKVLKRELTRDSMVLRRFEREAKAASHLRHPNVVEVLDWGVDGEEAFISMELAQGTDLLKALARQRPMKQVRAVLVLAQVCAALAAAHSKGIVHRDLKPENILLIVDPTEPGGDRAKVLDFGIAKILDMSKAGGSSDDPPSYVTKTALTRVGTIVGTPAYMSPEQCRGGEIDGRSDLYACGVLLYQLVTGELPFTGETPLHTAMRHIHAQPRPPSELRRDLSPALEHVITKALSKWPGERQQSADQLREELLATLPTLPDRGDVVLPSDTAAAARSAPPPAPRAETRSAAGRADAGVKAAPAKEPATASGSAPIEDAISPTRMLVGGALGATPLRAVRLGRASDDRAPGTDTVDQPATSGAVASLAPQTTQPEAAASVEESADDDEPRTAAMEMFVGDQDGRPDDAAASTQDPIVTPRANPPVIEPRAPIAAGVVEVKTDPMEQQARAPAPRPHVPTLVAQTDPPSTAPVSPRGRAPRTDPLAAMRAGAAASSALAAQIAPRPQPAFSAGAMGVAAQAIARPAPTTDRPARPAKTKVTETGLTPTMHKETPLQVAAPLPIEARNPMPIAAEVPDPSLDDDEPATYIREPPPSTGGKTLVMDETKARQASAGAVTPGMPSPGLGPSAYDHVPYAPQQEADYRGLKATARITDDISERATLNYAPNNDVRQAVKATVRMTPQDTPPAATPNPMLGRQPMPAPAARDVMHVQTGYQQLQPGAWNEPTVVKRKLPNAPPGNTKDGFVSTVQGLSGTTGLLIGLGLGLVLAAMFLIAFLLFVQ
ncbi:MAG: protein kinase [Polyangiaceae bacterium]|nr:protein kinase [Polyangiaceae bacterium]